MLRPRQDGSGRAQEGSDALGEAAAGQGLQKDRVRPSMTCKRQAWRLRGCSKKGGTVSRASPASMARTILAFGPLARGNGARALPPGPWLAAPRAGTATRPARRRRDRTRAEAPHPQARPAQGAPAARRPGQIPSSGQPRSHFRALSPHSGVNRSRCPTRPPKTAITEGPCNTWGITCLLYPTY
jgi:hypothetical protein